MQLATELARQHSRGFDHGVEPSDGITAARQCKKEAEPGNRGLREIRQVEGARFRQARHTEERILSVAVLELVKDSVEPMLETEPTQCEHYCLACRRICFRYEPDGNDLFRQAPR